MAKIFLPIVLLIVSLTKSHASGFYSEHISGGCDRGMQHVKDFNSRNKFYLLSTHGTIITGSTFNLFFVHEKIDFLFCDVLVLVVMSYHTVSNFCIEIHTKSRDKYLPTLGLKFLHKI